MPVPKQKFARAPYARCALVYDEEMNGNVVQQLVSDAGEFGRQLLLQLRLQGTQHLVAVFLQEQVRRFGCGSTVKEWPRL